MGVLDAVLHRPVPGIRASVRHDQDTPVRLRKPPSKDKPFQKDDKEKCLAPPPCGEQSNSL